MTAMGRDPSVAERMSFVAVNVPSGGRADSRGRIINGLGPCGLPTRARRFGLVVAHQAGAAEDCRRRGLREGRAPVHSSASPAFRKSSNRGGVSRLTVSWGRRRRGFITLAKNSGFRRDLGATVELRKPLILLSA